MTLLAVLLGVPVAPAASVVPHHAGAPPVPSVAAATTVGEQALVDRLLITPHPAVPWEVVVAVVGTTGRWLAPIPQLNVLVLEVPAGQAGAIAARLAALPLIATVEVDGRIHHAGVEPNDPYWHHQWGADVAAAPDAWGITTGSADVTIAVLDTGLTPSAEFDGKLVPGWDVLDGDADVTDRDGHGTQVASIAAAVTDNGRGTAGFCWDCQLMPVRVLDDVGYTSDLVRGVVWAVEHGADVLNISLVSHVDSEVLRDAIADAVAHGVVVVAAAGNEGDDQPVYPAALPDVVAVAATDEHDRLTPWSNRGPWVDVAAPGSHLGTTVSGDVQSITGTSAATPAVAGIVGLLLAVHPHADVQAVHTALTEGVVAVEGIAGGRVHAGQAVGFAAGLEPVGLRVAVHTDRGMHTATLDWDEGLGSPVAVSRDGTEVARVEGTAHVDRMRSRGPRRAVYAVCGPLGCADPVAVRW